MPDLFGNSTLRDWWWLKPDEVKDTGEVGAAYRLAVQQQSQNNYLKQLQAEKIQQAMQLQRDKALSETLRSKGMTEITGHISEVARTNSWDDPASEAAFWDIASKYPQSIEKNDIDAIYRNTFLEAKRRKEQANRIALPTAVGRNRQLIEQYDQMANVQESEGDLEGAAKSRIAANEIRAAAGQLDPNAPLKIETQQVQGQDVSFLRDRRGNVKQLKLPDESKVPADEMVLYRAEMKNIEDKVMMGEFEDPKTHKTNWDAVQKARDEVYQKHHRVGGTAPKTIDPNDPLGLFSK